MHEQHHRIDARSSLRSPLSEDAGEGARAASDRHTGPRRLHLLAPVSRSDAHADSIGDDEFGSQLIALMPNLRAFALRLAGGPNGEDFAQDALAKAWQSRSRFQRGTSMKAWVFTILRNHFLSAKRRDWRSLPLEQSVAEDTLVANDDAFFGEELLDVRNAMHMLPLEQRDALILAGSAGLTYEETAVITGCAVGTVKSRVSRGRAALVALLDDAKVGVRARSTVSAVDVANDIIQSAALLVRRAQAA